MTIPNPAPTLRPPMPVLISRTVAVIGAGAAGLSAALELRREGHQITVYEQKNNLGGTWSYTPETESDPIGSDPTRIKVQSSLYASLRTNLPREVMGFRDYPFVVSVKPGRDPRRFPGHGEVLAYLKDYADKFGLCEYVRFGSEVEFVGLADKKWTVRLKNGCSDAYDAVVVCNGHYSEPRVAEIPGIEEWPGRQVHSHNYRVPEPFRNQVVVLIGGAASADDISREIAKVAKEVHIASRSVESDLIGKLSSHDNIWLHPMINSAHKDGSVAFQDGDIVHADIILHCSGYKYHFPFLETNGVVTVDDNRVGPLYKHVFPPSLAPWISFVGLPWKVVPFPLFEYQNKWIAGVLSGRLSLPSYDEMMADTESFYSLLKEFAMPKRYTHNMASYQFQYDDWLAGECGSPPVEEWRKQMYIISSSRKRRTPEMYRDQWEDEDLIKIAHEDFQNHTFEEVSV